MKIGLISINIHTNTLNFASPLHTYAFHQFLKDNGIKSTVIDYTPFYGVGYNVKYPLYHYKAHPNKDANQQNYLLYKWLTLFYQRIARADRFEEFTDKFYKSIKTDENYTAKILDEEDLGFDCYICVTDVIWKNIEGRGFEKGFMLGCESMKGKKKIAYAASRGATNFDGKEEEFLNYISDFDYIAIREESFQKYIEELAGIEVPHVLDPVFLQDREFYENIAIMPERKQPIFTKADGEIWGAVTKKAAMINRRFRSTVKNILGLNKNVKEPEKKGFVLIYTVMEKNTTTIVKNAVEFAQKHDLDVVEIGEEIWNAIVPEGTYHDFFYDIGVEEWLGYLLEADYIFTNSFHACVLSIIFEKQFFAGKRGGDKITSLLEMFGLSWRRTIFDQQLTSDKQDIDYIMEMGDIDYTQVRPILKREKEKSSKWILDAIHDLESRPHNPLPVVMPEKVEES
jgi:hypothetical protein